jgi:hypothetical protein
MAYQTYICSICLTVSALVAEEDKAALAPEVDSSGETIIVQLCGSVFTSRELCIPYYGILIRLRSTGIEFASPNQTTVLANARRLAAGRPWTRGN